MNPQNDQTPSPHDHVANSLSVTQPGERTLCTITRHPVGILGIYVMSIFVIIIVAILAFAAAPSLISDSSSVKVAGALAFIIVIAVCVVFSLIATKVYWGNSWVVTTDSITQINQTSLFNRQSSQLSLDDVEDVTSEQKGIFAQIFKYGTIKVETAGEQSKFVFNYCPNPNYYAQKILAARETFEQAKHTEENIYQPAPNIPASAPQYQQPAAAPEPPQPPAAQAVQPAAEIPQSQFSPPPLEQQAPPQPPAQPIEPQYQISQTPLPPQNPQPESQQPTPTEQEPPKDY